jgi:plastocyanin
VKALAVALAATAVLGVAACGGGGNTGGQPAGSIKVTMTEFHFDPSTLDEKAGKLVFFLVNAGTVAHDMIISDSNGNRIAGSDLVSAGDSAVFTVDSISAGTYKYFCDQPGHENSGMKGELTVS